MKKNTNKLLTVLLLISSFLLISCQKDDPNYLWLLALANPGTVDAVPGDQPLNLDVVTNTGTDANILNNTTTVTLNIVVDSASPQDSINITVSDPNAKKGDPSILYTVSPNTSGNTTPAGVYSLTGTFNIDKATNQVYVDVVYNGTPLHLIVDLTPPNVINVYLSLKLSAVITVNTNPNPNPNPNPEPEPEPEPEPVVDSDGDGIADTVDAYPNDPDRASVIKFPSESDSYTIAYEDHYNRSKEKHHRDRNHEHHGVNGLLNSAKIDFNDYVAKVSGEADLNAAGEVVRVRMNAQHLAGAMHVKGGYHHDDDDNDETSHTAEYKYKNHHKRSHEHGNHGHGDSHHRTHAGSHVGGHHGDNHSHHHSGNGCRNKNAYDGYYLKINIPVSASYEMNRSGGRISSEVISSGGEFLPLESFELLPSSRDTIASSNTKAGEVFQPGMISSVEFILETPAAVSLLGTFPYDIYISYKKGKREVHLPGYVLDEDGKDPFLASNGFRWAIVVEGDWKWPLEHVNIHSAYPDFYEWYTSSPDLSWFVNSVIDLVYSR